MPWTREWRWYLAAWVCGALFAAVLYSPPRSPSADEATRNAIEKLHQQDVTATLAHDPQALADLFTEDAVLLEPGSAPVIGKQAILAENKKDQAEHSHMKVVSYTPEIKDIQIVDGIAYEWDYFDASFSESGKGNDVQTFRAKALRILKRQPDGSWKFSRVMWNLAEDQTLPK
jgi:uncharacterized protein (TIGR02246 family)